MKNLLQMQFTVLPTLGCCCYYHIFTKWMSNKMYASINKQYIGIWNFFVVLFGLCQVKGQETFSHFTSLCGQHTLVQSKWYSAPFNQSSMRLGVNSNQTSLLWILIINILSVEFLHWNKKKSQFTRFTDTVNKK
jgi:hypothetical protein